MYELVSLTENVYYIESPAKIGVVKTAENEAVIIDSGNDKDAGKKILKIFDANGWKLKAIYNTHSNADHIGGNAFLREKTGCQIYAPGVECAMTNHPILEPAYLYGGYPCADLRHKFLLAKESKAEYLSKENLPAELEMIPLPGHFFDMVGFRTADDVVFLADCLSSKATLDKYKIGVIYDVAAYLDTLERVKGMTARLFVPSHAAPTEDISELADYNINCVKEIADNITESCITPVTFEELLKKLFDDYSLAMTAEQYVLVGSTVRSYLSYLKDGGKITAEFSDNRMLWKKI